MKRAVALSVLALAGACTTTRGQGPEPVVVAAAAPTPTATRPPDPRLRSFRENLEHAKADAERAGWQVKEVIEIPDHHAALVLYDPTPASAPATRVARVDAVGAGPYAVTSAESGIIDAIKTRAGSLLWDLRGDGSKSVVLHLTPCGANCGVAKPLVLELDAEEHSFHRPAAAPDCPTCSSDEDGDGVPEFEHRLVSVAIAPCSRASCGPASALEVEVRGLERWNGSRYARDLARFVPLYAARLRQAKKDSESLKKTAHKSKICPLAALSVAARTYVYGRLAGESRADARSRADEILRGWDTRACTTEYDLLAPPKTLGELMKELEAVSLPRLEGK